MGVVAATPQMLGNRRASAKWNINMLMSFTENVYHTNTDHCESTQNSQILVDYKARSEASTLSTCSLICYIHWERNGWRLVLIKFTLIYVTHSHTKDCHCLQLIINLFAACQELPIVYGGSYTG